MSTSVELLRFQPQSTRTAGLFSVLASTASRGGVRLSSTDQYQGNASWLMLWGPGGLNRMQPMERQLAAGGHVICWDLAYWQRDTKLRVSIDAPHPQQWVMRKDWPAERFIADRVQVSDQWNPKGPAIVAGLGRKARLQYGQDRIDAWERSMIAQATQRGYLVRYRRKQEDAPVPAGVPTAGGGAIERVLTGAGLVITWHSNVAVDAIRMGIPVICYDGAAAAVSPSTFSADENPKPLLVTLRDRFLANLAFFQWEPSEAVSMWAFLRELLA